MCPARWCTPFEMCVTMAVTIDEGNASVRVGEPEEKSSLDLFTYMSVICHATEYGTA